MAPRAVILALRAAASAALIAGSVVTATRWIRTDVPASPVPVAVAELATGRPEGPRVVEVADGEPSWSEKAYGAKLAGGRGYHVFARDPRVVLDVDGPQELFARRASAVGGYVRMLSGALRRTFVQRDAASTASRVPSFRAYAPVDGTRGRLWVASGLAATEKGPELKAVLTRTQHTGRLVTLPEMIGDQKLWDDYAKAFGASIPTDALVIDAEEAPELDGPIEIWAPLTAAPHTAWVVYPEDAIQAPGTKPVGVYARARRGESEAGLFRFLASQKREYPDEVTVVAIMSPSEWRSRVGQSRVSALGLGLLAGAAALVGLARALAARRARATSRPADPPAGSA